MIEKQMRKKNVKTKRNVLIFNNDPHVVLHSQNNWNKLEKFEIFFFHSPISH